MFDARAYYATLEVPVFIAPNGREYRGRILGADTWERLQQKLRLSRNSDGSFNPKGLAGAMRIICDETFPPNRWKPWDKSVADWVWELPEIGRYRAVWDFMQSQAKARGESLPPMPGTSQVLKLLQEQPEDRSPEQPIPSLS